MKKKNSISDYVQPRNENLREEFMKRLGGTGCPSVESVFRKMKQAPAKRFYINEERAYVLLKEYRRNGNRWPDTMQPQRRRMLSEINRRVVALREEDHNITLKDAVWAVVNSPAPEFYLTIGSIRTLLYEELTRSRRG